MGPRRLLMIAALVTLALCSVGDLVVHAATCRPLREGSCHACKNCRYCGHCAKRGGVCSVCR
jgi:hypothetical protein